MMFCRWQIVILALALGCQQKAQVSHTPAAENRPGHAPTLEELAAKIVSPTGYSGKTGPDFYNRENLYKAIDGMAPEYISYGCKGLAMLEWAAPGKSDEKLQLEIYDMGSPLGAYGIYSRAHTGEGEFADIGEEAAVAEDSVEFARANFYVRILGPLDSRKTLESMGRDIIGRIPAGPRPETLFANLPETGRLPRTDRWIPEAGFGMEFMKRIEVARYKVGDKEIELHVAPFADAAAARAAFEKFRQAVSKQAPKPLSGNFPGFLYTDKWIGRVGVFRIGDRVAVVVGYEKTPEIENLLSEIKGSGR